VIEKIMRAPKSNVIERIIYAWSRGFYAPESATMSFWDSPCAAKREVRLARPDVGGGMLLLAPLKLAVVESLLPTLTLQLGPPSCIYADQSSLRLITYYIMLIDHIS
jgi:hypothetical protein